MSHSSSGDDEYETPPDALDDASSSNSPPPHSAPASIASDRSPTHAIQLDEFESRHAQHPGSFPGSLPHVHLPPPISNPTPFDNAVTMARARMGYASGGEGYVSDSTPTDIYRRLLIDQSSGEGGQGIGTPTRTDGRQGNLNLMGSPMVAYPTYVHTAPLVPTLAAAGQSILEEPWTEDIEKLVKSWREDAMKEVQKHQEEGDRVKRRHNYLGLPPILLPLAMTALSPFLDLDSTTGKMVTSGFFLISGLSSALYKWLDLGQLYEAHYSFSARYNDIVSTIDAELARQKNFRRSADAFVTEIKVKMEGLNRDAPNIEVPGCCAKRTQEVEDVPLTRSEFNTLLSFQTAPYIAQRSRFALDGRPSSTPSSLTIVSSGARMGGDSNTNN